MLIVALTGSTARTDEDPQQTAAYVPGELLVQFKPGTRQQDRAAALDQLDAASRRTFRSGAEHWILGQEVTVEEAIAALGENEDVLYAEPNMIGEFTTTEPGDDLFQDQWALAKIEAPDAWDFTTGSSEVIIAVLDTGIEPGYWDLSPPTQPSNIWSNTAEVNGDPNVDDDGNGYVDDTSGWDVADDDNDPRPTGQSHGTPVAGIIGAHASSTGFGIAGINWSVKMMNLRIGGPALPTVADLIEAIEYAVDNGAHIINYSGGIHCDSELGCSQLLRNAIQDAAERDVLVISSAGNNGTDIDGPEFPGFVPASYDVDNIIAVAMSDPNDLAVDGGPGDKSNYGAVSVDLAAPGIDILTLGDRCLGDPNCNVNMEPDPDLDYVRFAGTSAATPHVSGVAGLIKSLSPDIPYELIRLHILDPNNVDPVSSPDPNGYPFVTVTDGRVNMFKAVGDYDPNAPAQITNLSTSNTTLNSVQLNWTATADDGSDPNSGAATLTQVRYSLSTINSGNWLLAKRVSGVPAPGDPNTTDTVTVDELVCNTTYYFALKSFDEWGNGPLSNVASQTTDTPLCVANFCGNENLRCTWTGQCGADNCCVYACSYNESCTAPDECPSSACSCPGGA